MIENSADALPQPRLRTQWGNMQVTAEQSHRDRAEKIRATARRDFYENAGDLSGEPDAHRMERNRILSCVGKRRGLSGSAAAPPMILSHSGGN